MGGGGSLKSIVPTTSLGTPTRSLGTATLGTSPVKPPVGPVPPGAEETLERLEGRSKAPQIPLMIMAQTRSQNPFRVFVLKILQTEIRERVRERERECVCVCV